MTTLLPTLSLLLAPAHAREDQPSAKKVVDATKTRNCARPDNDANGNDDNDGDEEECQTECRLEECEATPSIEYCAVHRADSRCGPSFLDHYSTGTTTDYEIVPRHPYFSDELLDGWVVGSGGELPKGLFVFDDNHEDVERAMSSGELHHVQVAVRFGHIDDVEGVRFGIVDEGPYGFFLTVADPVNEAAAFVPFGNLGFFDNRPTGLN